MLGEEGGVGTREGQVKRKKRGKSGEVGMRVGYGSGWFVTFDVAVNFLVSKEVSKANQYFMHDDSNVLFLQRFLLDLCHQS